MVLCRGALPNEEQKSQCSGAAVQEPRKVAEALSGQALYSSRGVPEQPPRLSFKRTGAGDLQALKLRFWLLGSLGNIKRRPREKLCPSQNHSLSPSVAQGNESCTVCKHLPLLLAHPAR